jgi:hypothetical protein
MDSFQQSGLKTSSQTCRKADIHLIGHACTTPGGEFLVKGASGISFTLESAMMKDIEPLRSSFSRTAEAGEYARWGGIDTRE